MRTAKEILHNEVADEKTPAISYIFFNKDSIIFEYREGKADILNNIDISSCTTFNGFSVTKTFTALAVLQLEEKGLLKLSDPVNKYLPGFAYGEKVTIQHLLNHTAGIPNPIPLKWIHLPAEHKHFNRNNYFRSILDKNNKPQSPAGEKFKYSNLGYILLGQVIEKVTDKKYEEYISDCILNKVADPSDLSFNIDSCKHAKGYQKKNSFMNFMLTFMLDKNKFMDKPEGSWKPFKHFYMNGAAYGGIIITAQGMVQYGQAILNDKLLSGNSKRKFFTENKTNDGKPTGMCISWFTDSLNGQRYFHHAGGGGGYYVEFRLYPDIDCGSIIIFNRSGMKDERFLDKVDTYFLGQAD